MASQSTQTDPKYTETETIVTFDEKNNFENASEDGTNKYNYVWLTGEERYASDNENEREEEAETSISNVQHHQTANTQPVVTRESCLLCELEGKPTDRDRYFDDEVIVVGEEGQETDESNNINATSEENAEAEDNGHDTYPYNYVLLSDKEDAEEVNSDSTTSVLSTDSEKDVVCHKGIESPVSFPEVCPVSPLDAVTIRPVSFLETVMTCPISFLETAKICPVSSLDTGTIHPVSSLETGTIHPVSSLETGKIHPVSSLETGTIHPVSSLETGTILPVSSLETDKIHPVSSLETDKIHSVSSLETDNIHPVSSLETGKIHPVSSLETGKIHPVSSLETGKIHPVSSLETGTILPVSSLETDKIHPVSSLETGKIHSVSSLETDNIHPVSSLETGKIHPVSSLETGKIHPVSSLETGKSRAQLVEADSTTSVPTPAVAKEPVAVGLFGLPACTVTDIVHRLWNQAKEREATDEPGKDTSKQVTVNNDQAKQTTFEQSKLPAIDPTMGIKKRGRKPLRTFKINKTKMLSPKKTYVIKAGCVVEKKKHAVKGRKRKSKNSDMLMQEAEKYLTMCGVGETTSESFDGQDDSQLGRTSRRLAGKQKVNYHELVQCGNSISSSSQCSVISDESFEDGVETYGNNLGEHRHMSDRSLKNIQARADRYVNEKWKQLMPTPTSRKMFANTKYVYVDDRRHGIANNKQVRKPPTQEAAKDGLKGRQKKTHSHASVHEPNSMTSQASDHYPRSLTSSPEPCVLLDKLVTRAWMENHTVAQNSLQRQMERVEKADMDARYNCEGRHPVRKMSVHDKRKKMNAHRLKRSLLAVTKKITESDPDFVPQRRYPCKLSAGKKVNLRKAREGLSNVQTFSSISAGCKTEEMRKRPRFKFNHAGRPPKKSLTRKEEAGKAFNPESATESLSKKIEVGKQINLGPATAREGLTEDAETGKRLYPCKYCGRRYSRPYVYMHQAAHRRKRERAKLGMSGHVRGGNSGYSSPARTSGKSSPAGLNSNKLATQRQGVETTVQPVQPSSSPFTRTPTVLSPVSSRKPKGPSLVSSRTYGCSQCKYKANDLHLLRGHTILHGLKDSAVVKCKLCDIVFKSRKAFKIWHTKNKRDHTYRKGYSKTTNGGISSQDVRKDKGTVYSSRYSNMEQVDNLQASTRPILPLVSEMDGSSQLLDGNANTWDSGNANQGTGYTAQWAASHAIGNTNLTTENVNLSGRTPDANNTGDASVKDTDSKLMNKVSGLKSYSGITGGKVDENANVASASKAPVSSLSCVSCEYVSESYEDLGSHFIANHFPGQSETDANNNNPETLVSNVEAAAKEFDKIDDNNETGFQCDGNVAGGFAKKYRAKKQKQVYAYFNKELLLENQSPMPLNNTPSFGKSVNTSGIWYPKTSLDDTNANSTGDGAKMGNRNKDVKKCLKGGKADRNNNVETEPYGSVSTLSFQSDRTSKAKRYARNSKLAEKSDYNKNVIADASGSNTDLDEKRRECSSIAVEMLTCLVCQTSFSVKADLMKHLSRIHRLTNLCQICYFREGQIMRFANPVSLRNHKLRCHPDDMVKCVCGAMLIDKKMLTSHLRKFRCDQTGQEKQGTEMVKCVCGKRFGSPDLLAVHKMKCRKRSHSEGSDSSSLSSVSPSPVVATSGKGVTSPAFNTRSLGVKMEDEAGGSGGANASTPGWSPARKRQLRDRKPVQYAMMEMEESPLSTPTPSPQVNIKSESRKKPQVDIKSEPRKKHGNAFDHDYKSEDPFPVKSPKLKIKGKVGKNQPSPSTTKSSTKGSSSPQPVASSSKTTIKKAKAATTKTQKKKPGRRKKRPDADGRYPCKTCRRRFKRPYLYVHQKTVHARKQWVYCPTARPKKGGDSGMTYRCGWCKFVAVHWRTVIHHHYSRHGETELDVVAMVTKPTGAAAQ